jgi:hypothetical protein
MYTHVFAFVLFGLIHFIHALSSSRSGPRHQMDCTGLGWAIPYARTHAPSRIDGRVGAYGSGAEWEWIRWYIGVR